MPKAYLHIGAPKCASSLIQRLLNEHTSQEIVGPEYQAHLSRVIQSHTPAMDADDFNYRTAIDAIRDEIPRKDVLFSVENVFGMLTHRENVYDQSVKVIDRLFPGFDVKIFCYVRRQDTFLESMYNQDVKRQETRDFDAYMSEIRWDNLHWDALADNYSKYDLTIRPFEKSVLKTGGYDDFLDALYQWLGEKVIVENLPVVNASLSPEGLAVQLFANRTLSKDQAYNLSTWMERYCPKKPDDRHEMWGDRNAVLSRYRESNKRLFEKYMPAFDPSYYLGTP